MAELTLFAGMIGAGAMVYHRGRPTQPPVAGHTRAPVIPTSSERYTVETLALGLERPWSIRFIGDRRMLVTELAGRMRIVDQEGIVSPPLTGVPPVRPGNYGGLLGLELDPDFRNNRVIYFSFSEQREDGAGLSVARAKLNDGATPALESVKVIFRAVPSVKDHATMGGRIQLAPDGTLFVSTGDRLTHPEDAQLLTNDLGKIVRINRDGTIPKDNPFIGRSDARPEIYSYGHRNPEGLAIDPSTGQLWEQEHGARGGDEINIIRPGRNYGWPVIAYGANYDGTKIGVGTSKDGMEQPLYYWDPSIAPSGLMFYTGDLFPTWKGSLFNGALKYRRLYRMTLAGSAVTGVEAMLDDSGQRIRDVAQGPDGALYVLTDETNGAILRIVPAVQSASHRKGERNARSS